MADLYSWIGASGGVWMAAANWADVTLGLSPAGSPPGGLNPVSIAGSPWPTYEVITGGGNAASLALTSLVDLQGSYALGGLLSVGPPGSPPGDLLLATGSTLLAGAIALNNGMVMLAGNGSALDTTGPLTIGAPAVAGAIIVNAGASLAATGPVVINNGSIDVSGSGASATLGAMTLASSAASATLNVASGATVEVAGDVVAPEGSVLVSGSGAQLAVAGTLRVQSNPDSGASLEITGGGTAQLGGLAYQQFGSNAGTGSLQLDTASALEIGNAGTAVTGALTVDSGAALTAGINSNLYAPSFIDNGLIAATAGTLTLNGTITGRGTLMVENNARLVLNGSVANTAVITMSGTAAALDIGGTYGFDGTEYGFLPDTIGAPISGFAAGDSITLDRNNITAVSYTGSASSLGGLTLLQGRTPVGTLILSGDYSHANFLISPTVGGGSTISLLGSGGAARSPMAANADTYAWTGASGGAWTAAVNWADTTQAVSPAAGQPGGMTPVSIVGSSGPTYAVITGGGVAASLTMSGLVDLVGNYTLGGTLAVGAAASPSGNLLLAGGSTVLAGAIALNNGVVVLSGTGATLGTSGPLSIGGGAIAAAGAIDVGAGGSLSATGPIAINNGSISVGGNGASATLGAITLNGVNNTAVGLDVANGGTVGVAGNIVAADGSITVSSASLSVAGTVDLQVNNASGACSITGGGTAQMSGMAFEPFGGTAGSVVLSVDGSSALEIGNTGNAAIGALTVDAGATLACGVTGAVYAPTFIDDGTICTTAGTLTLAGNVVGNGTLLIDADARMVLNGSVASTAIIAMAGNAAALDIGASLTIGAVIDGFVAGDSITLDHTAITGVSYTGSASSLGGLTLLQGGTPVGLLILDGDYSRGSFLVAPTIGGGSTISFVNSGTAIPIAVTWWMDAAGNFADVTNWSGGAVPGVASNVTINFADRPEVLHDSGDDTLQSLTNMSGDFVMSGGTLAAALLTNDSAMGWSGGSLLLNGGTLLNAAGATLSIAPNGQRLSVAGSASLANAGSITVDGGLGEADIDAAFSNTGNVLVNRGTLSLNGGGSSNAFLLQTGSAGVLQFGAAAGQASGGTFALTGGVLGGVETVISGSTLDASAASNVFFDDLRLTASGALNLGATNAQTNAAFVQGGTSYLSGSGTFSVFGGASISGGVQSGTGLTRLFGTGSIGGGFAIDGGRTVENDSFLSWSSGNIILGAGNPTAATQSGTLANVGSGILYVTAPGARLGGSGVLSNSGVVAFYAGAGEQDVDAVVNNIGYLQALSGVVSLNGGGSSDAGHLIVVSGATLQFGARAGTTGGATFTLTGGGLTAGSVIISGSTLDASAASGGVSIGTLQLAGSGALLLGAQAGQASGGFSQGPGTSENASGTPFLSGTGTFLVFGGANLSGGVQSGSGTTRIFGTSVLGGSGFSLDGGRTLENDGWLNWSSGNLTLGSGDAGAVTHSGTLTNVNGATMFVTASGSRIANASGGVVNNAGVMAVYAGGGEVDIDAAFNNTGYLQALSGVVSLNGGGSSDAGHLIEGSGAVLQFGTAASGVGGTFTITGGFYNAAVTQVTGGLLDLSAASGASFGTSMAVSGSGALKLGGLYAGTSTFDLAGGTLSGTGAFTVGSLAVLSGGLLTGAGTLVLAGSSTVGGSLQIDGGHNLQNSGTLDWSGGSIVLGGGDATATTQAGYLDNVTGGRFVIQGAGTISAAGTAAVFNSGTIVQLASTLLNAPMNNTGVVMVQAGTLSLQQAVTGAGAFDIEGSARLDFANIVGTAASIAFIGGGGTLAIDSLGTMFGAAVSGFALGDGIDLTGVQSGSGTSINFSGGALSVTDGAHTASVRLIGGFNNASFVLGADGHGGTLVLHS